MHLFILKLTDRCCYGNYDVNIEIIGGFVYIIIGDTSRWRNGCV